MKRSHGQALIEFALVSPILLLLLMGIFDFSRVFITFAITSNSLRSALRMAEVRGYDANTPDYLNCTKMDALANNTLFGGPPDVTIVFRKPDSIPNPTEYSCATVANNPRLIENGDMLVMRVTSTVNFVTPLISSMFPALTMDFSGQRTIVTQVQLGSLATFTADSDYDGLNDAWEMEHFGNLDQAATDDWDDDGCNEGCEESRNLNPKVRDTDGDGILDGDEVACGTDPGNNGGAGVDADGDGLTADLECSLGLDDHNPDWDGDGLTDGAEFNTWRTNPALVDTDRDGLSDGTEVNTLGSSPLAVDSDRDGLHDAAEVTLSTRAGRAANYSISNFDSDRDGLTDGEEVGFTDGSFAGWGTDPFNGDTDGDFLGDGYELMINDRDPRVMDADDTDPTDPDTDGDNLTDGGELLGTAFSAHCGFVLPATNPRHPDTDGDGDQDDVDCNSTEDSDHDGLADAWEMLHFGTIDMYSGTDNPDADQCDNECEETRGLNPLHPDTDGDGLMDGDEVFGLIPGHPGIRTNPTKQDSDGDCVWDGVEVANNTNLWIVDSDADSLTDGHELGMQLPCDVVPFYAVGTGTNPNDPDTDRDGLTDYVELTRNDTDPMVRDADDTDPLDPDSDDDGLNDGFEVLISRTDPLVADSDGDGLNDGFERANNTDPSNRDTDGDGLWDGEEVNTYRTIPTARDTDGDGLSDYDEVFFGSGSGFTYLENGNSHTYQITTAPDTGTRPIAVLSRTLDGVATTAFLDPIRSDSDGDRLLDGDEVNRRVGGAPAAISPFAVDTDGDGVYDGVELNNSANPRVIDTDGDGATDYEEIITYGTRVDRTDTDQDRLSDGFEIHFMSSTFVYQVNGVDHSPDAMLNPLSPDTDNDGIADYTEIYPDVGLPTNPLNADTDGDAAWSTIGGRYGLWFTDYDDDFPNNQPTFTVSCNSPSNCIRNEPSSGSVNQTFNIVSQYIDLDQSVNIRYQTADGTAISRTSNCSSSNPADFKSINATLRFSGSNRNRTVAPFATVNICRDNQSGEPAREDYTLNLSLESVNTNVAAANFLPSQSLTAYINSYP
jgi:hypothetical protein